MSNHNDKLNQYVELHGEKIKEDYEVKQKSIGAIAKEYGTYTQKIFRVLKKMGTSFRTKSEAQKVALTVGRSDHPTEGKKMSTEQKINLGISISASYENSSQEDKDRRSKIASKRYHEKTPEQLELLRRRAGQGILESAKSGSKLERFLLDKLTQLGYNIVFHKKGFILNENLEIDLLIPSMKVAIEVDGIFHTEDVWNNGSLDKVQNKDSEKNALLLMNGYVMIRLSNTAKSCSQYYMRERLNTLYKCLEEIKLNFPPIENRLIYLGE